MAAEKELSELVAHRLLGALCLAVLAIATLAGEQRPSWAPPHDAAMDTASHMLYRAMLLPPTVSQPLRACLANNNGDGCTYGGRMTACQCLGG